MGLGINASTGSVSQLRAAGGGVVGVTNVVTSTKIGRAHV